MVDFGFGPLLDKFEQHYGRVATKALIGLVGAAAASTCLGVIWSFLSPIVGWGTETAAGHSFFSMVSSVLWYVGIGGTLFGGVSMFSSMVDTRRILKDAEYVYSDSADQFDEAASISNDSSEVLKMSLDLLRMLKDETPEAIEQSALKLENGIEGTLRNAEKMKESARRLRKLSDKISQI